MSPTSYQTAPPRTSIINNGFVIVKLTAPGKRSMLLTNVRESISTAPRSAFPATIHSIGTVFRTGASHGRFLASNQRRVFVDP
jgi:hypothetical protein